MLEKLFTKILENIPSYITDVERQVLIRKNLKQVSPEELNVFKSKINEYLIKCVN